jgi:DNA-binding response OmpR family regulator
MHESAASQEGAIVADFRPIADDRPSLLLIDDDSMVGRFIAHAAEECGYRSVRTTSIDSFSRFLSNQAPDAVAVDLCVPGSDGVDVIRFLAEESYAGAVIIISGMDRRVLDAALRLGKALGLNMAEPLAKPFRLEELARRLPKAEPMVAA